MGTSNEMGKGGTKPASYLKTCMEMEIINGLCRNRQWNEIFFLKKKKVYSSGNLPSCILVSSDKLA